MNTNLRLVAGGALAAQQPESAEELVACDCGDAWFELVDGEAAGAIAIQQDGSLAAIVGRLKCASCGRRRDLQ